MNADWIEREIDHILVIQADDIKINQNEVSEIKWVSNELHQILAGDIGTGGEIAPWFRCIAERVMTDEWWDSIGNLDRIVN